MVLNVLSANIYSHNIFISLANALPLLVGDCQSDIFVGDSNEVEVSSWTVPVFQDNTVTLMNYAGSE